MNALAIDHGTSKCGLAFAFSSVAIPIGIVETASIWNYLDNGIPARKIDTVVVWVANNMDGTVSRQARIQEGFAKAVSERYPNVRVILWDERLTTAEAALAYDELSVKRRPEKLDDVAASILLQSYLETID